MINKLDTRSTFFFCDVQERNLSSANTMGATGGLPIHPTGRNTHTCTHLTNLTTAKWEVVINLTHIHLLWENIWKSTAKVHLHLAVGTKATTQQQQQELRHLTLTSPAVPQVTAIIIITISITTTTLLIIHKCLKDRQISMLVETVQ